MWWWLVFVVGGAHAECAPTPVETVRADVIAAERALSVRTLPDFKARVAAIRAELPCVAGPLTPDDAVHLHAIEWLSAWFEQRSGDSARAFQAARRLDPGWRPVPAMAAEGTEIYERGASATSVSTARVAFPPPAEGWVLVDGRRAPDHPVELPYVLQYVGPGGAIVLTRYQGFDDAVPAFPAGSGAPVAATAPVAAAAVPVPVAEASAVPVVAATEPASVPPATPEPTAEPAPASPAAPMPGPVVLEAVPPETRTPLPTTRAGSAHPTDPVIAARRERRATRASDGRPSRWLLLGGAGAGVMAGTLALSALAPQSSIEWGRSCEVLSETEARDAGCKALATTANVLSATGLTLGVAALGSGVAAFVVGNW